MKNLLFAIVFTVISSGAMAQENAIQSVISNQIAAFQSDDFKTAFSFAAPSIQSIFKTPERFGQMVQNGYPMVHRPRSLSFKDLRTVGGNFFQDVLIEDSSGRFFIAEYAMRLRDGVWEIAGVNIKPAPLVGT